ncbi:MAG: branched-chain alpha-keto acid dehydrogenase subunit E2 [Candidatus Latescibacteria bacterium]|nr:branched-chain alpha-keto acid dehydrogenase subunit E2 [Candidatus Latescibacterota bacterium]
MSTPFNLPPLGENIESGTIVGILVSVGDTIAEDQAVLEIETDKATLEVPSTVQGVVQELLVKEGDQAVVGEPVLTVEVTGDDVQVVETTQTQSDPEPVAVDESPAVPPSEVVFAQVVPTGEIDEAHDAPASNTVPAAPSVRRFAREIGIDIRQVTGTGAAGRISIENVKLHAKNLNANMASVAGSSIHAPAVALPDFEKWGPITREPVTNLRRAAAAHLSRAWTSIPHVTYADKADITDLEALRKKYGPRAEAEGGKLTMTAIALKFAVAGLKKFPNFNASIDMARQEIVYKSYYHIGVAVDTDRGLVVPVIRDVDQKSIIDLTVELAEIAAKARDRKLSLEDMQGSTFTLTNLGGFGGEYFTPIINAPDVAILGLARGRIEPVYRDGAFEPRLRLPLMISYDHRLIDGADGARFMKWLIEAFEQPFLLSLEG